MLPRLLLAGIGVLSKEDDYNSYIQNTFKQYLIYKAGGIFFWVVLVCYKLTKILRWRVDSRTTLFMFPPGLDNRYKRMV